MDHNLVTNWKLRRRRRKIKRVIRISLFILIVIGILVIFNQFSLKKNDSVGLVTSAIKGVQSVQTEDDSLKLVVENALEETKGTYGIVIKNLKTGESYFANEHRIFEAGSLYKLWTMAVVYQQIQSGELQKEQVLSEDIATLNQEFDIDPDKAEQTEGTIALTVNSALTQMITISHNYAALLLTQKVKLSSVAAFLQENGLMESTVGTNGASPTVTPADTAFFLEKLYKGELASQEYSQEMIELLKNQKLNDGLSKYLPDQSKVAHKTGDIGWFKHDGGIVFTEAGDYIIMVMSESDSPAGAQERIALISKAVYDYFNKK
ncbi:hypothetical protein A2964_02600 [Candidatus Daviesbacteria bacterium RIFCSPLOWO2_01_FULL_40_27]|nr:MAG: hypothetical protein A2964_02600 [Candidatus Daviesbacteria bacterium RIFCSPLOWO2_01_FULL_40_27]